MGNDLPIGVFDSGIGGMTVVSSIARVLPGERIFYFGDTARCPYGDRDATEVRRFAVESLDYLVRLGVKLLVVACNTATAIALPELSVRYDVPVIGVIQPGAHSALELSPTGRIGVIGTAVTVQSGAYAAEIHKLAPDVEVFSLACPPFVPLVESGQLTGAVVQGIVNQTLAPLVEREVDVLIMGCTHYPLLQAAIQQAMGQRVRLISSAQETARQVQRVLTSERLLSNTASEEHQFFTTGDGTRMWQASSLVLNIPDPSVAHVDLVSLQLPV